MIANPKQNMIGIDIGGTKISVSLGTSRGKLLDKVRFSSRDGTEPQRSIDEICKAIHGFRVKYRLKKKSFLGAGIGVPGHIDSVKGRILKSPNLPGWNGLNLKAIFEKKLTIPVFVENDANVTALGERYFGDGKKFHDFLYVTVSTGIGSGIIANGKLVRGASGAAGEIGHMVVVPNGQKCNCGKRGCLEAYGSGTAIANYVKNALKPGSGYTRKTILKGREITGFLVADAAEKGDKLAIEARQHAAEHLGIGLANVINLLNPQAIILGGGVMEMPHHFWQYMIKAIKRETWPLLYRNCRIIRSTLQDKVADYGVFALVLDSCRLTSWIDFRPSQKKKHFKNCCNLL